MLDLMCFESLGYEQDFLSNVLCLLDDDFAYALVSFIVSSCCTLHVLYEERIQHSIEKTKFILWHPI